MGTTTAQAQPGDVTVRQLSDGNGLQGGGGNCFGINAQDEISFYGATPIQQPSGPGEAAITRGQQSGCIGTINSTAVSPTAVANNTTAEYGMTLLNSSSPFKIAAGDLLFINKPTSQAGLGVGNVRVSAANVAGVTFSNFTAATITPTATQSYAVVAIRGFGNLSATLTPAAVAPNTVAEQQFTVTGLRSGSSSLVQVIKPTAQAGLDIVGCRAVSDNTLGITFANVTAATITPTAGESYTVFAMAGIDSVQNNLMVESLQSPASVANATSAEQGLTVTGLAASDIVVGVSKPTAQAGLGVVGWRVSAANTLGLTFGNFTAATITPTATESYAVSLYRPNPVAPMVVYSQTLTPVAVAANTTAEQTFTVTGLIASTPVWVNKPSATPGLGIAGVRVSATNTLAINYCNGSSASITPPSEAYVIGNFQVPLGDAGSAWVQTVDSVVQSSSILGNSTRAALVNLGLMAGA